jgi:CrcB protein
MSNRLNDFLINTKLRFPLLISIGGALGASARYGLSLLFDPVSFPYPTLSVNILGCFLLAYLLTLAVRKGTLSNELVMVAGTGFLGAFTTFSTFALEALSLGEHHLGQAVVYVGISLLGGITASFLGYLLALGRRDRK